MDRHRKEKDPLHAPDEPTGDELPVEPELQEGLTPDPSGRDPGSQPPKTGPVH
jgi:hypothetical protein